MNTKYLNYIKQTILLNNPIVGGCHISIIEDISTNIYIYTIEDNMCVNDACIIAFCNEYPKRCIHKDKIDTVIKNIQLYWSE